MKKKSLIYLLLLFTFQLQAADYYWVGGLGNWSDLNHWRLGSSTGSIPSIVPSLNDNVFFTAESGFTAVSKTVTINANAFCNDMTWEAGVTNNPILTKTGTSRLTINGNFTFNPTVTFTNILADLSGSTNNVLTTNGAITGTLTLTINKPGGGITLADNYIYTSPTLTSNTLELTAGFLDAQGKTLNFYQLTSNNTNNRLINISNGLVEASIIDIRGVNKTINASASVINSTRFYVDEGIFNEVNLATVSAIYLDINNTTFQRLVFTNIAANSQARIHSNNVVDTLIFRGSGSIRNNYNIVNNVLFEGGATIGGIGNVIGYAETKKSLDIIDSGNNTFGSLVTAPNHNIKIVGLNTINNYFKAGGLPCDGFTEITGSSGATFHFQAGAVIDMDNVLLANIVATGPNTPIAVTGIDNGGTAGFTITEPIGTGTTLYWVGGAGDWNDRAHWSTASGGVGGACIPFIIDDVVFDANSGFTPASRIVVTSGNTYCRNMNWEPGILSSPIFNANTSFLLNVYGSVVLNPTVTMNATMYLKGTQTVTLTTNASTLGNNRYIVQKTDVSATSGLILLDNWNNTNGRLDLVRGVLDLQNRTLNISVFASSGAWGRNLNISNANITLTNWSYIGTNIAMNATGSIIIVNGAMATRSLVYNIVRCNSAGNDFDIISTTFDRLTFENTSLTSEARISNNNIINILEYKGQGMIRNGGNVINSLITAENRNFYFYEGSNTITNYLKATHPSCSGLGEIRSGGTTATVVFGANAVVDIANVYLENITATGGGGTLVLPIAFSGFDAGGNSGWVIGSGTATARYWVGGGGDWNDASHWSLTSGGPGGACIPTANDDVFFDALSGFGTTAVTRTVTVNTGNAYFHNISWVGALNNPIWTKAATWNVEGWGDSIMLNPTVTSNLTLLLRGSENTVLTGSTLGNFSLDVDKLGGSLTFANDYSNPQTLISMVNGNLNVSGKTLTILGISNNSLNNPIHIDISDATINGNWIFNGATSNRGLIATNSTINAPTFNVNGFVYNTVNVAGNLNTDAVLSNTNITNLTFTNPSSTSAIGINGSNNIIETLEYKGSGGIYGTGNTINTLIFFPGKVYTLNSGTNNTITGEWYGSGSPCFLTEIKSSGATAATITKTSGEVDFDYVRLTRIVATGGANFTAREHSIDFGGNTGWVIFPYNGASPILGLGPDLNLIDSQIPYTINTDGFFGSPLSQYVWSLDGEVIGTSNTLVVTQPGTYSVTVTLPDGCSINDQIVIAFVSADLSIEKTVDNLTPAIGDNVVFTITTTNNGPATATGINVIELLPSGYTFVSSTLPLGTTYDNVSGIWDIGDLALAETATMTITATVNATGTYLNTVSITSTSDDPDTTNNSASVGLVPDTIAIVTQPICAADTGTIEIPVLTDGTYSIDGGLTYLTSNIFTGLAPGDYTVITMIGTITNTPTLITITVQDTTAPVFVETLPADITVECDAVPTVEILTTTDATVTFAEVRTDGACPNSYSLARTWTATDACGLTTVHTQTITVQDTTAPVFVEALPADITVECDAVPTAETLTATDNCGTATVTFTEARTDGACPNIYSLARTWTATDACGLTTVHTQTITVQDTTAPTFVEALPADVTVEYSVVPTAVTLTATDNCGTATVTFAEVRTDGACPNIYSLVRTWTATDACGLITVHTQTITVQDTMSPSVTLVSQTTNCDASGLFYNVQVVVTGVSPFIATGNGAPGTWIDNGNGTSTWTSDILVTGTDYSVDFQDANVCSTLSIAAVSPVCCVFEVTCPTFPATAVECYTNLPSATILTEVEFEALGNADGVIGDIPCGVIEITASNSVDTGTCPQIVTRTYTITEYEDTNNNNIRDLGEDTVLNTQDCFQTITVQDTTAPAFVEALPADITVECDAVPTAETLTATDNCGTATVTFAEVRTDGACPNSYSLARTWTATDACGLTTVHTQTITVQDTTAPAFVEALPADATVECDAVPTAETLTATDNCGTATVTFAEVRTDGACPNSYSLARTWTATDACGLTTVHTQTITVQDTTAPAFVEALPADATVECDAVPTAETLTATDNCGTATVTFAEVRTDGACPNSYSLARTWTATDACGLTTVHTQTITVQDTTAPAFVEALPADATVECDAVPTAETLTATDNCGTATVTFAEVRTDGACPNSYSLARTWTATDACGLTTVHTQTITVQDTTAPTFVEALPADATVECDAVPTAETLTATDNCGTATVTFAEVRTDGACPNSYSLARTWTATDACGLTTVHTQTITVQDTTAPAFVEALPADATVECDAVPTAETLTATDNCGTATVTFAEVRTDGACPNSYSLARTWTATDACGLTTVHTQTITVQDTTAPTFVEALPADATVECDAVPTAETLTATDNCGTATVTFAEVRTDGACPNSYSLARIWTATDACGLTTVHTQTITVQDTTAPTFVEALPVDVTLECTETIPTAVTLTATDNCSSATVVFNEETFSGSCPASYEIVRTWTATDECGNYVITTQTITVQDTTAPVFTGILPQDGFADCDNIPEAATVTATDNCGEVTISFEEERIDGDCSSRYELIRTWTATDECGNTTQHIQTINLACHIKVWNALSPNGDGHNDVFLLDGIDCYPNNSVEIYNRWGAKVYETRGYDNISRVFEGYSDGRSTISRNNLLPTGTYFYILRYEYSFDGVNGKQHLEKSGYLYIQNK